MENNNNIFEQTYQLTINIKRSNAMEGLFCNIYQFKRVILKITNIFTVCVYLEKEFITILFQKRSHKRLPFS